MCSNGEENKFTQTTENDVWKLQYKTNARWNNRDADLVNTITNNNC